MATININGRNYNGTKVVIRDGIIAIDDVVQNDNSAKNAVDIRVLDGTIFNLETDRSVSCGRVNGNVSAGGSVNCDDVHGDVNAGGSVNCDDIAGHVVAGGSVRRG